MFILKLFNVFTNVSRFYMNVMHKLGTYSMSYHSRDNATQQTFSGTGTGDVTLRNVRYRIYCNSIVLGFFSIPNSLMVNRGYWLSSM